MCPFGEALRDLNLIKSFKPQRKGRFFIKEVFMEFKVKVQQEREPGKEQRKQQRKFKLHFEATLYWKNIC